MSLTLKPYPGYKESGLLWVGKLPFGWNKERAKWLFQRMQRPVRSEDGVVTCFHDGMVTLRSNRRLDGFTESLKEIGYQGVRRGDLVIHAMDAFAGAIGVADSDGKSTPVYSVCAPRTALNVHYYANVVREMARSQWIVALAKGIRERSTDFRYEAFANEWLPFPSVEEQDAIASFIQKIDTRSKKLIRAKRRVIELLNEQKQAIIQRVVTRGLDPNVRLKPSRVEWFGEIPAHWDIKPLKFLSSRIQNGATPSTSDRSYYEDGTVAWYGPSSIGTSIEIGVPARFLNHRAISDGNARLIQGNAIAIIVIGATAGKMALMKNPGTTNQQITCFKLISGIVNPEFAILQTRLAESWLRSTASTATIPILDSNVVCRIPVALPPIIEQVEIVERVRELTYPLSASIGRLTNEIALLREYRTRLIADVVTGKLDVRGVELPELGDVQEVSDVEDEELEDSEELVAVEENVDAD